MRRTASGARTSPPRRRLPVGRRALPRVDGWPKVAGTDAFGADEAPADALWLRVVRSPHARARFALGDLDAVKARHPGLAAILTSADVPGENAFGIFPRMKDQPVLAPGFVRFRGEAVLALVGTRAVVEGISDAELADRTGRPRRRSRHRRGLGAGRPRHPRRRADNVLARATSGAATWRRGTRAQPRPPRALRDRVRRARLYRARGRFRGSLGRPDRIEIARLHPGALHGPGGDRARAGRRPLARAHPPDGLRRRFRRQARRIGTAAAGGGGVGDQAARAHRLHAAPSRWPPPPSGIRRASGPSRRPTPRAG